MPKLSNRPPKPSRHKSGKNEYAIVYIDGKKNNLGRWGSPEAKEAYARFEVEWWKNYRNPIHVQTNTFMHPNEGGANIGNLVVGYFAQAEGIMHPDDYRHVSTAVFEFLLKLYSDKNAVDSFTPKCLKLVRTSMVQSGRFCRKTINSYVKRIVAMFRWGVEEDMVAGSTWHALKAVKALRKGEEGTFDHAEREEVPDDVVALTLQYLPSTVSAMVQIQGMTGMRPTELCTMRVGDVNRSGDVWEYRPKNHKTEEYIGKKVIHLGKEEQALIAPYLAKKTAGQAVFSPAQAMKERHAEKRANRKTKITPSQAARDAQKKKKPVQYAEFYDTNSYRKAIEYGIARAKREGVVIPHWTPYQLRHGAGTRAEKEYGLDEAQALLHHTSAQMTKRYAHGRQVITKNMARNRRNPFATPAEPTQVPER